MVSKKNTSQKIDMTGLIFRLISKKTSFAETEGLWKKCLLSKLF